MPGNPVHENLTFTAATNAGQRELVPAPGEARRVKINLIIITTRQSGLANTVVLIDSVTGDASMFNIGAHPDTKVFEVAAGKMIFSDNAAVNATLLTADANGPNVAIFGEEGLLFQLQ